jgi:hypothetical protein
LSLDRQEAAWTLRTKPEEIDGDASWAAGAVHLGAQPVQFSGRCREAIEVREAYGEIYRYSAV